MNRQRPSVRRRRGTTRDGAPVVPEATFTSYYGRPVLKASPWHADIPGYLFLGGVAAGSSLLGAGAELTNRPALRRAGRLGGLTAITVGVAALLHDMGRPARFAHMLRVAKPTSPMSVGTWLLSIYGPLAGMAGTAELVGLLPRRWRPATQLVARAGRPAGLGAAVVAPAIATYTAVLLADTATPAWHEAYRQLPYVFVGSAAAASGGLAMMATPVEQAGPARRLALTGALVELTAEQRMEGSMGIARQTLHTGTAGRLMAASRALTSGGATATLALEALSALRMPTRWARTASAAAGAALLVGSAVTRFAIFHAGQQSARDPRYTVIPQRERVDRSNATAPDPAQASAAQTSDAQTSAAQTSAPQSDATRPVTRP